MNGINSRLDTADKRISKKIEEIIKKESLERRNKEKILNTEKKC